MTMATLTRKERERRDRERLILDTARKLLSINGYLGLKMDQIAHETEYSKGTIYLHFSSKEDVIMELAAETLQKRVELFERAAKFEGRSRERLAAIGMAAEIFVRSFPDHFRVEQIIRTDSIREKAAPERQEKLADSEFHCMQTLTGIIHDAVAEGDLQLPEFLTAEQLTFGMWSLSFGASSIITTGTHLDKLGIEGPYEAIINNIQMMLDGLGWQPLMREWDYANTFERVSTEVFPEFDLSASST